MSNTEFFVLAETDNLSPISLPLKSTQRIKYTCFTVSQTFLIFGATSGGLYVFKREPCVFLQLLPNKEGSVTQVAVSPDEKFFVFATLKGVVCILERSHALKIRRFQISTEHQGSEITALHWNGHNTELYVGDDLGKVSVIHVPSFMARNLFQTHNFIMMQLDSRIVQLDWYSDLLLISTLSRCYLCDTVKERYRQVGVKLRDGEYGACFYATGECHYLPLRPEHRETRVGSTFRSLNDGENLLGHEVKNLKMFCARPGSRMWEVNIDGIVLSTHQFKEAFAVPPKSIIRPHEVTTSNQEFASLDETSQNVTTWSTQSFNFVKLFIIAKKFIFTFRREGGLYVLDPDKGNVVLWSNNFKDIIDAKPLNDSIYVWTASGAMHNVVMLPLEKFLVHLYLRKQYSLCAWLCEQHNNYLLELAPTSSKLHLLADLDAKLDSEVTQKISPLLKEIAKYAQEKRNAQRLKSGIFLIGNTQFFWNEEEEQEEEKQESVQASAYGLHSLRVDEQKEKSRSLSASPESSRRKRSVSDSHHKKCGSTTSLPELVHRVNSMEISSGNYTQLAEKLGNASIDCTDSSVYQRSPELKSPKSNESISSSDSLFAPEAIQALKDLGQNFPWKMISKKSLKEKWQMLEGKMKLLSQETMFEPLDVRPADYQESSPEETSSCEDIHASCDIVNRKSSHFPVLDVSNIIELCKNLGTCNRNGGDKAELVCGLLNNINRIYELFIALIKDYCDMEDNSDRVQSLKLRVNSTNPGIDIIGPFPFHHYFADDVVKLIREEVHLAVKTGELFTWLRGRLEDELHVELFPDYFVDILPEDTLKLDILLSRILVIYSDILDPKVTLQYIKSGNLACYYLSLCAILDRYQEGNLYYIAAGSTECDNYEEMPLPLLLNTLYFMLNMERIETCCKLGKQVDVRDVWYLVMRTQQQLEASGKDKETAKSQCYLLFLCYLEKLMPSRENILELLTDTQLKSYITAAFEELHGANNGSCVCGFPVLSPPMLLCTELAAVLVEYYWKTNQERFMELGKNVPALWNFVLPLKRSEDFSSILPLIIHLGASSELTNWLPCMDFAAWEQMLDNLTKFRAGTCLNCGFMFEDSIMEGITWSTVGPLIVKSLGPHQAVQLLAKYASYIKPGELDERFFQSCIYSAIIDNHAKGLRNKVIDMLNMYSKKTTETAIFSPVVGPSLEQALKEDLGKPIEFCISSEKHHWGVKINVKDGNCPCCSLPLGSPVLMKDGGITTFHCGHSYHVVCLKRQVQQHICPICTKNS